MQDLDSKAVNELFMNNIMSDDAGQVKLAQQAVNDFTRVKMREDGFWRRILPPVPIANDELDRQVDTDKNVKVVDKEPNSPAAASIPYATLPMNRYIRGPRYRVMFDRIVTPRFTKDVTELRTWDMDIRQVLSDNAHRLLHMIAHLVRRSLHDRYPPFQKVISLCDYFAE